MDKPVKRDNDMIIGYARISRDSQDLGRQIAALEQAGCEKYFQDVVSGGKTNRENLDIMMHTVQPGDVVIVQKLDRLGRSLQHLIQLVYYFRDNKIGFKSLSEAFDTTTPAGEMIFHILGAVAQFERSIIRERTKDGLHFKRASGVQLGRRAKDYSEDVIRFKGFKVKGYTDDQIKEETGWKKGKFYKISRMYGTSK